MATLGHLPTRGLGILPHLPPRVSPNLLPHVGPNFQVQHRPHGSLLTRGGIQYWSKHFSHPTSLPMMLSLTMGMGCYLGLRALTKYKQTIQQTVRALLASRPTWEGKGYHMGPSDDVMREVLLSIET